MNEGLEELKSEFRKQKIISQEYSDYLFQIVLRAVYIAYQSGVEEGKSLAQKNEN